MRTEKRPGDANPAPSSACPLGSWAASAPTTNCANRWFSLERPDAPAAGGLHRRCCKPADREGNVVNLAAQQFLSEFMLRHCFVGLDKQH